MLPRVRGRRRPKTARPFSVRSCNLGRCLGLFFAPLIPASRVRGDNNKIGGPIEVGFVLSFFFRPTSCYFLLYWQL